MNNRIIIQGFGARAFFFKPFMEISEVNQILDNETNTYEEVKKQLLSKKNLDNKFDIIGWSLGSIYALKFALEYPERVSSLFLVGATARFCEKNGYSNGIKSATLNKMIKLISVKKEIVMKDFYNSVFAYVQDDKRRSDIISQALQELQSESALIAGLETLLEYDLLDDLSKITCPVMIINGQNDKLTPPYGAREINNRIKGSVYQLTDGGHAYFLESPSKCSVNFHHFTSQFE